jgi:CO/xanthine dehydrogenase Mo-binding subunit
MYTKDVTIPGMVYGKFYRSPVANGVIKSMDTSVARAMPGVLDILRYDDPEIKGKKIGSPYSVLFGGVPALRDAAHFYGHQLALCSG